mgnify:CR=1 FL=1
MKLNSFQKFLVVTSGLLVSCVLNASDAVDDIIVDSDYYQQSPSERQYDQKTLAEKERLADSLGEILAQVSKIEDEIYEIDKDLARYESDEARRILLLARQRLFRKRREYKNLAASYTLKQVRMTQDLSYNSQAERGSRGDAYAGSGEWTTGNEQGGLDNPNWGKASSNQDQKSFFVVKNERNLKEVAAKVSESIYGDFNQDIYVEILQKNMGNTAIQPSNLLAGDHIFIPYKVAMLTVMGLQQKTLLDSTMLVLNDFKDEELRRELIKASAYADENPEAKQAFIELLIAGRLHGEESNEFKKALTNFNRLTEGTAVEISRQMLVSERDADSVKIEGAFRERVTLVSNASLQLEELPSDIQDQVKQAAGEYHKLKTYTRNYGERDQRTKTQFEVFSQAVERSYASLQNYRRQNPSAFVRDDRYRVNSREEGAVIEREDDTREQSLASVDLKREIREMNSMILTLLKDVSKVVQAGWEKKEEGIFESAYAYLWDPHKKDATRSLHKLTDIHSETSVTAQLMKRLRVLYGTAYKYQVDLYRETSFSILRKRMISLIGMSAAIAQVQPSLLGTRDGSFRNLRTTEALQRLGIDIDKRDFDFYDRDQGAKPQFQKLFARSGSKVVMSQGVRQEWLKFVSLLAEMKADFRDQENFSKTLDEAKKFWEAVSDKLDRTFGFTIGYGVAGAGAGTLAVIAAANFWNPVGWVSALVIGGGTAAGALIGNATDQRSEIDKVKEYASLKIITDLALASLKEHNLRPVEGMLYLDEIVMGY